MTQLYSCMRKAITGQTATLLTSLVTEYVCSSQETRILHGFALLGLRPSRTLARILALLGAHQYSEEYNRSIQENAVKPSLGSRITCTGWVKSSPIKPLRVVHSQKTEFSRILRRRDRAYHFSMPFICIRSYVAPQIFVDFQKPGRRFSRIRRCGTILDCLDDPSIDA